jgi:hypothetical protein
VLVALEGGRVRLEEVYGGSTALLLHRQAHETFSAARRCEIT